MYNYSLYFSANPLVVFIWPPSVDDRHVLPRRHEEFPRQVSGSIKTRSRKGADCGEVSDKWRGVLSNVRNRALLALTPLDHPFWLTTRLHVGQPDKLFTSNESPRGPPTVVNHRKPVDADVRSNHVLHTALSVLKSIFFALCTVFCVKRRDLWQAFPMHPTPAGI